MGIPVALALKLIDIGLAVAETSVKAYTQARKKKKQLSAKAAELVRKINSR